MTLAILAALLSGSEIMHEVGSTVGILLPPGCEDGYAEGTGEGIGDGRSMKFL